PQAGSLRSSSRNEPHPPSTPVARASIRRGARGGRWPYRPLPSAVGPGRIGHGRGATGSGSWGGWLGMLYDVWFRRRAKVLYWDGTGLCLFANQLSSHYTSFDRRRGPWFLVSDARLPTARSLSRSQRLQCFVGCVGGSS